MIKKREKFYVTSSIAYTNAPPHLGFTLEVVQADVLARYHRSLSEDVFFLTGTDEHGIKTLRVAREVGKEPKEFADEISEKFKTLNKVLNISNDDFIRTTDEIRHKPAVEKVWKKLEESGDIYKKKYKGFYCAGCETFITEKDLVNGSCPIHQKKPELVEEENYFFKLSKYTSAIEGVIKKDKLKIIPETRKNETLSLIKQGLEDVSFSRAKDKYWGFAVPGDPSQILYVWCDALPNYISAIGYYKEDEQFKKYWPADVHCLGKDIMKFHTIFWPAMLLSLGLPLPKTIFVHGFITVSGQKMSKSLGNIINPFELVEKYGTDAVRYFLLREIPSTEDGDFTLEKFEIRYNADLANGLGNFAARILTLKFQYPDFKPVKTEKEFENKIKEVQKITAQKLEEFKFNESLAAIWDLIAFGDKYINQTQVWKITEAKSKNQIISNLLAILNSVASLLAPFLPETSARIPRLKKGEILFPRL